MSHGRSPTVCRHAAGTRLERMKADWAATWVTVVVLGSADRSWSCAQLHDTPNPSNGFAAMLPLSPSQHPGATWNLTRTVVSAFRQVGRSLHLSAAWLPGAGPPARPRLPRRL